MSINPRSQPYRLDPPVNDKNLPQIVTNADEMFQILFEDIAALDASLTALEDAGVEGDQGPVGPIGHPGQDGASDESPLWAPPGGGGIGFVPYIGAITNVDIGAFALTATILTASSFVEAPTFSGGNTTTSVLHLRATRAAGISGSDIIGEVGNNGGTEAFRAFFDGRFRAATAAGNFEIGGTTTSDINYAANGATVFARIRYTNATGNLTLVQDVSGTPKTTTYAFATGNWTFPATTSATTVTGTTSLLSPLATLGTLNSVLGVLKFNGNTSGTVTIQSAAAAGTWTLTLPTTDGDAGQALVTDGSGVTSWSTVTGTVDNSVVDGRLTVTTATPVNTANVTSATSLYYTPYKGNRIALYDGSSAWAIYTFTEITLALGTVNSGRPYDVFAYNSGGTVTLEMFSWTNTTTRATALVLQDGVLVRSGATTRRYLGTFHTISTSATCDYDRQRFVWNYYNRVELPLRVIELTDSWTYTTASYRQVNATATNQVEAVIGWTEDPVTLRAMMQAYNSNAGVYLSTAVGQDSTTVPTPSTQVVIAMTTPVANYYVNCESELTTYPAVGYHYWAWLERSGAIGTSTWFGDAGGDGSTIQTGLAGSLKG